MKQNNILGVIQARMGSTRFPGKPIHIISGKTMLEIIYQNIKESKYVNKAVVASTVNPKDNELEAFLKEKGIEYFRGPETDIAGRLHGTAKKFEADTLVRVWGDCPLILPEVIDKVVYEFIAQKADYATNSNPSTFPFGMNLEVYSYGLLERIVKSTDDPFLREFPFEYVKQNKDIKLINVSYAENVSDIELTVDYPEDSEKISAILSYFKNNNLPLTVSNIVNYARENKQIFEKTEKLPRNIEYKEELMKRENLNK